MTYDEEFLPMLVGCPQDTSSPSTVHSASRKSLSLWATATVISTPVPDTMGVTETAGGLGGLVGFSASAAVATAAKPPRATTGGGAGADVGRPERSVER